MDKSLQNGGEGPRTWSYFKVALLASATGTLTLQRGLVPDVPPVTSSPSTSSEANAATRSGPEKTVREANGNLPAACTGRIAALDEAVICP